LDFVRSNPTRGGVLGIKMVHKNNSCDLWSSPINNICLLAADSEDVGERAVGAIRRSLVLFLPSSCWSCPQTLNFDP
jgi:hypothetical protein